MSTIIITGTPGTGKSTVAKVIERKLHFTRIDVHKIIDEQDLCEYIDEANDCQVIDTDKLAISLKPILAKAKERGESVVIDSHLIHHLPKEEVDLCIVTKCDLPALKKRLRDRDYSQRKIRDNMDVEIFDNCLSEAERAGHKVMVVNTTRNPDWETIMREILQKLGKE